MRNSGKRSLIGFLWVIAIIGLSLCVLALSLMINHPEKLGIESSSVPEGSSFRIEFLDVGQGDCAFVYSDDQLMMIDGGSPEASSKVYSYIKANGIIGIDYMIATHPDSDHIGGLSAALNAVDNVEHALSPVTEHESKSFENLTKYLGRLAVSLEVPEVGTSFKLGSATVYILGPVTDHGGTNDDSIVIRIVYGKTSFLFTGDAEEVEESELLESKERLKSTLIKVAHHGSSSSSTQQFIDKVNPKYALISVGENSYGHPTETVLKRLEASGAEIFRTDEQGTITVVSDGKKLTISTEKEPGESNASEDSGDIPEGTKYIGNIYSKKFHSMDCTTLPKEYNRVYFSSREEAVDEGYSPCGSCRP